VGSPHTPKRTVVPGPRLVTATVAPTRAAARPGAPPVVYRILTDRPARAAAEVVQRDRWRWQIKPLFRWRKTYVPLPRLLGYARPAVELTVWLAVIVHLRTRLAAHARVRGRRSPALLRQGLVAALLLDAAARAAAAPPAAVQRAVPLPLVPF